MALIELSQVTKYYEMGNQVVRALDGIDISVTRNDYMAFIGSSGSGKSTMLKYLAQTRFVDASVRARARARLTYLLTGTGT